MDKTSIRPRFISLYHPFRFCFEDDLLYIRQFSSPKRDKFSVNSCLNRSFYLYYTIFHLLIQSQTQKLRAKRPVSSRSSPFSLLPNTFPMSAVPGRAGPRDVYRSFLSVLSAPPMAAACFHPGRMPRHSPEQIDAVFITEILAPHIFPCYNRCKSI